MGGEEVRLLWIEWKIVALGHPRETCVGDNLVAARTNFPLLSPSC